MISGSTSTRNPVTTDLERYNGRERPADYVSICNNFGDSYPNGTAHGVQKDAIQNSMDARKGRKPAVVEMALITTDRGRFFTIMDANTTGLTGDVKCAAEYEDKLAFDDHWARFEGFAFTKDDPNAIGARGQGKFIFLHASTDYSMYYDTLRDDRVYRVGATRATRTGCPIYPDVGEDPWEGTRGAGILKDATGLTPIDHVGTRIVVIRPKEELCEALANGEFFRAIQETWFRAVEKNHVLIRLRVGSDAQEVSLPAPYPLPTADSRDHKVWRLGKDFTDNEIRLGGGETYHVKNFHAVYLNRATVPEDLRGLAIIHNEMKICTLPMNMAPPHVRERVTGFIEFDRDLDRELRKGQNQHPNHYDLKWRRRIPHAIRDYVNAQLGAFGRAKLGLGVDPREQKRRRRSNAEDWAMRQLMRHARDLDLFGAKGPRPPRPDVPPAPPKPIGVAIHNFSYPDPDLAPRVNWGQTFAELKVTAYNRTEMRRDIALTFAVLRRDSAVYTLVDRHKSALTPKDELTLGPFDIIVDQQRFSEPGEYRLKASLFDRNTGDLIDKVIRRFWVEKDPPLRRAFELDGLPSFPPPDQRREWKTGGSINNSAIVYYNTSHPAYRLVEDDEEKLGDYLLDVALQGAIQFVLARPNQQDGSPDFHPLDACKILGANQAGDREEVPSRAYDEIAHYLSEVRWRVLEAE